MIKMTIINIIGEFRKAYIKQRIDGINQDAAKSAALHTVQTQLLHTSAAHGVAVNKKDLTLLEELEKNPHYTQLLEDVVNMPEEKQREYLRTVAAVPKLRLVK